MRVSRGRFATPFLLLEKWFDSTFLRGLEKTKQKGKVQRKRKILWMLVTYQRVCGTLGTKNEKEKNEADSKDREPSSQNERTSASHKCHKRHTKCFLGPEPVFPELRQSFVQDMCNK